MANKNLTMHMIAGLDIGNGYVKGSTSVNGSEKTTIDFMSGVAVQTHSHDIKTKEEDAESLIKDIFNEMECSFDTPMITNNFHRLFGRRGVSSGRSVNEFDVSSTMSKADDELSSILVCGCLAGKALQAYFKATQKLPTETIQVYVDVLTLALPITEYKAKRKMYAQKFREDTHMVTIYNFERPIRVELHIDDVNVTAEGASAQYAIVAYGTPLMQALLDDLAQQGEKLEGITAADVLAAENTVGIDIGEGTVNFPVYQNGRFNPDVSMSFSKGYGTVLEQARDRLDEIGFPFASRKSLADFLMKKPSPLQQTRYNRIMQVVREECDGFADEVGQEFLKVMSKCGSYTEVVFVYGGGSGPLKEFLHPRLIDISKHFGGEDVSYPILYLNSMYSRTLNREGLYIMARTIAEAKAKEAKEAAAKK